MGGEARHREASVGALKCGGQAYGKPFTSAVGVGAGCSARKGAVHASGTTAASVDGAAVVRHSD